MDDSEWDQFKLKVHRAELDLKGHLVEFTEENCASDGEKVALMSATSIALAAAALHAAVGSYNRGDHEVAKLTMSLVESALVPELEKLMEVLGRK